MFHSRKAAVLAMGSRAGLSAGEQVLSEPFEGPGSPDGLQAAVPTAAVREVGTWQLVMGAWLRKVLEAGCRHPEAPGKAPGPPQSGVQPLLPQRSLRGWAGQSPPARAAATEPPDAPAPSSPSPSPASARVCGTHFSQSPSHWGWERGLLASPVYQFLGLP